MPNQDLIITVVLSLCLVGWLVYKVFFRTSYTIPVAAFRQQFVGEHTMKEVTTLAPNGRKAKYETYAIDFIDCIDKKGNPFKLKNGPSLEIRFTDQNRKQTVFYFYMIRVDDVSVSSGQSRIMPNLRKSIPLNSIDKIEIQDGGKRFKYVK